MKHLKILLSIGFASVLMLSFSMGGAQARTVKHDLSYAAYQVDQAFISDLQFASVEAQAVTPFAAYICAVPACYACTPRNYVMLIRPVNDSKPDNTGYQLIKAKELKLCTMQGNLS